MQKYVLRIAQLAGCYHRRQRLRGQLQVPLRSDGWSALLPRCGVSDVGLLVLAALAAGWLLLFIRRIFARPLALPLLRTPRRRSCYGTCGRCRGRTTKRFDVPQHSPALEEWEVHLLGFSVVPLAPPHVRCAIAMDRVADVHGASLSDGSPYHILVREVASPVHLLHAADNVLEVLHRILHEPQAAVHCPFSTQLLVV